MITESLSESPLESTKVSRPRKSARLRQPLQARGCLCAGGIKSVAEILGLIGGATLAVQAVVLGASLFQKAKAEPEQGQMILGPPGGPPGPPGSPVQRGQVQILMPNASTSGMVTVAWTFNPAFLALAFTRLLVCILGAQACEIHHCLLR